MAKVLIPPPLRQYAGKQDSVELTGSTVGEVLTALTTQHPDLRRQLYNDEGKLRSFVNVYLNDEDIRYLEKDATPVKDGDTVSIVPSIAGGPARWRRSPRQRATSPVPGSGTGTSARFPGCSPRDNSVLTRRWRMPGRRWTSGCSTVPPRPSSQCGGVPPGCCSSEVRPGCAPPDRESVVE